MALSELASEFRDTMPSAYRSAFAEADMEEHARMAQGRELDSPCVALWRALPQGTAILCVIAEDRPGLVALVSAAFLAHALDVRSAQIYCRTLPDARLEAVDFFWLCKVSGGLPEPERLEACARTFRELLGGAVAADRVEPENVRGDTGAKLSYARAASAADHWEVALEARDFPGLLHVIARLLHQHGLEVSRCEIRTEDGIARDRFLVSCFTGVPAEPQLQAFRRALLDVIHAVRSA